MKKNNILIYVNGKSVCLMVWETGVQSQVESYQRFMYKQKNILIENDNEGRKCSKKILENFFDKIEANFKNLQRKN